MNPDFEKIVDFVMETQKALSGFSLDAMAMRGRLPMLRGIISRLTQAMPEMQDPNLRARLTELATKAQSCCDCIRHRLLIKS